MYVYNQNDLTFLRDIVIKGDLENLTRTRHAKSKEVVDNGA